MDDLYHKLNVLADSAKYDVACTSSGTDGHSTVDGLGSKKLCGICHSFAADGRCVSLLKVLMSNVCVYDCQYCVNRRSNDVPRATFTPEELADLTIQFYKRNYIEGLFLSSGIIRNPDYTCELMIRTLTILRYKERFNGYIHAKGIPGADNRLMHQLGLLADRMSVNIELPSQQSLQLLAPDKNKAAIMQPMGYITEKIAENTRDLTIYRKTPRFVPAGHSTQMIIGASPESDYQILQLTENLYHKFALKRVFFSAYSAVAENSLLPDLNTKPPLWREHRLYQADWLLRFYKFSASEILDAAAPDFNPFMDPKCNWAVNHMEWFPVEVNRAAYEELLRVPGIGVKSAKRILVARRQGSLDFTALKKLGVVLKRAQYFITCRGCKAEGLKIRQSVILQSLMSKKEYGMYQDAYQPKQMLLFNASQLSMEEQYKCLSGEM